MTSNRQTIVAVQPRGPGTRPTVILPRKSRGNPGPAAAHGDDSERSLEGRSSSGASAPGRSSSGRSSNPFGNKRICGDIFSINSDQNLEGILYRSRTLDGIAGKKGAASALTHMHSAPRDGKPEDGWSGEEDEEPEEDEDDDDEQGEEEEEEDKIYGFGEDSDSDEDDEAVSALSSRQRLALTLKNWCTVDANVKVRGWMAELGCRDRTKGPSDCPRSRE